MRGDQPDVLEINVPELPATPEVYDVLGRHQGVIDIECSGPINYLNAGKILTHCLGTVRSNKCIDCHDILSLKELRTISDCIGDKRTEELRAWLHHYMIGCMTKSIAREKEKSSNLAKDSPAKINTTILNSSESSKPLINTSVEIAGKEPEQVQKKALPAPKKRKTNCVKTSQVVVKKRQKAQKPTPVVLTNKVYDSAIICFVNEDALKRDFDDTREEPIDDEGEVMSVVMSVVGIGRMMRKKGSRSPGELKFLVSWVGFSAEQNTFETQKNVLALSKTPTKHSE